MWHPWLYHYGANWRVPGSGAYAVEVRFQPPAYRRYGRTGRRFADSVATAFAGARVLTGEK
jgi:hypothetical protein